MLAFVLAAVLVTGAIIPFDRASADVIIQAGVEGTFDDDNLISAGCVGGTTDPGLTITGCLQSSHTTLIDLTGDEAIDFAAGGQAKIVSDDGTGFGMLTIDLQGDLTLQTLILNIDVTENGFVMFSVAPGEMFAVSGNGNNFFSISNAEFENLTITSDVPIDQVRQIRLGLSDGSTPPPASVPAPASALIVGLGLATLWAGRRRGMR